MELDIWNSDHYPRSRLARRSGAESRDDDGIVVDQLSTDTRFLFQIVELHW
jgi:hypothetical protein